MIYFFNLVYILTSAVKKPQKKGIRVMK